MKIFSGEKVLSPASARNCFLMNQFATPGLGSLMGGRIIAGAGQLLLSVIGFLLVLFWFFRTMREYYSLMTSDVVTVSYAKFGLAGALFFAAAWLWSLLTSISLLREGKANESGTIPPMPPPRITNPPPKM